LIKPDFKKAAGIDYRYWYVGPPLDQGSTPQCVAFAGYKYLTAGPVRNTKLPFTPAQLYKLAQQNDEWPGENYDGTSVRGLFKYLNKAGYIPRYEWTFDIDTLIAQILTVGPLVVGTDWYSGMMEPDKKNLIHVTGSIEGGHGWVIHGCNKKKRLFRMINSWDGWGENGMAWISFDDFEKLLKAQGEACTATELDLDK
jgi:hypothetical protein